MEFQGELEDGAASEVVEEVADRCYDKSASLALDCPASDLDEVEHPTLAVLVAALLAGPTERAERRQDLASIVMG